MIRDVAMVDHKYDCSRARLCAMIALANARGIGMVETHADIYEQRRDADLARLEGAAAGAMFRALEKAYDAGQVAGMLRQKAAT